MLSAKDSETLTRVGAGTPMGELMRQYWLPALKSSELAADGDPVRFMLLGEKLIGFRDSSGRVGVMDHRCPHRCASLFFGRNEENGIRCVYHGWKFDVDGTCLEMANVPPHQDFRHKVRAKAYKTAERNGLVWVYMGEQADVPPLPAVEATLLPEDAVHVTFTSRECNWLQALEGDIDTSHFDFLHRGAVTPEEFAASDPERYGAIRRDPEYKVAETPLGTMYGAYRPAESGHHYWRIAHFMLPFWTLIPNRPLETYVVARAWVPLDDTHCMHVNIMNKAEVPVPPHVEHLPDTTDWLGRWRPALNAANDYRIDRAAQKRTSYTGIDGIQMQDQAITESMGPILDHSFERLAPSDEMITRTRRRLLKAARAFARTGAPPPGRNEPELYFQARSGYYVAPGGGDWQALYREHLHRAQRGVAPAAAAAE